MNIGRLEPINTSLSIEKNLFQMSHHTSTMNLKKSFEIGFGEQLDS